MFVSSVSYLIKVAQNSLHCGIKNDSRMSRKSEVAYWRVFNGRVLVWLHKTQSRLIQKVAKAVQTLSLIIIFLAKTLKIEHK